MKGISLGGKDKVGWGKKYDILQTYQLIKCIIIDYSDTKRVRVSQLQILTWLN